MFIIYIHLHSLQSTWIHVLVRVWWRSTLDWAAWVRALAGANSMCLGKSLYSHSATPALTSPLCSSVAECQPVYYWSQMCVFFQAVECTIGLIHRFNSWSRILWSCDEWNQWSGKVLHSLFTSLLQNFVLSGKIELITKDFLRTCYFWGICDSCAANCSQERWLSSRDHFF